MSRRLFLSVVVVVCLMAAFIAGVIITEKQNVDNLENSYISGGQNAGNNMAAIQPPSQKAIEYQMSKVTTWVIRLLLGIIIPAFFLFSRLSAGIRRWAESRTHRWIIIIVLYFAVYSLIEFILYLPLDFYGEFVRKHAYGLSNQTFSKWIGDSLKSFILSTFVGALVIWIPYVIIKRSPKYWWFKAGLLYIPFLLFMSFASPILIDPIFNKYVPIEDQALEVKIHKLINQTTIGDCDVYQINKSVDTKEMNAYMTGVFNTKRIVLWDTTVKKLSDREILCVVAHEMGHYLMGHVWKSIIISGLLCIIVLYFVNKSALWILDASKGRFGFNRLQDIASLPLLILLINLAVFIATPAINAYSRQMEVEADRFEIELTGDNHAAASVMVKLHSQSLVLPQPGLIYKLWNYDHPTFKERVDFANSYKPWKEHKPLKYQKYMVH